MTNENLKLEKRIWLPEDLANKYSAVLREPFTPLTGNNLPLCPGGEGVDGVDYINIGRPASKGLGELISVFGRKEIRTPFGTVRNLGSLEIYLKHDISEKIYSTYNFPSVEIDRRSFRTNVPNREAIIMYVVFEEILNNKRIQNALIESKGIPLTCYVQRLVKSYATEGMTIQYQEQTKRFGFILKVYRLSRELLINGEFTRETLKRIIQDNLRDASKDLFEGMVTFKEPEDNSGDDSGPELQEEL